MLILFPFPSLHRFFEKNLKVKNRENIKRGNSISNISGILESVEKFGRSMIKFGNIFSFDWENFLDENQDVILRNFLNKNWNAFQYS